MPRVRAGPVVKTCGGCGVGKPVEDFHWKNKSRGERQSRCAECAKAVAKAWHHGNRDRARENSRRWREENPERDAEIKRRWNQKHGRAASLGRLYGMSLADYDDLLAKQGGVCAICQTAVPGSGRKHFSVDHDHATGVVRGLLCNDCNRGLGLLGDGIERLTAAAAYLTAAA